MAMRTLVLLLLVASFGCEKANDFVRGQEEMRAPEKYIIPKGYVGWVRVDLGVPGAAALPVEDGRLVFNIPATGRLETSSKLEEGWAYDEYYYCDVAGHCERLPVSAPGENGMIWGQSNAAERVRGQPTRVYERFFVGTEEQFLQASRDDAAT